VTHHAETQRTLKDLIDQQSRAERIKNFPYPRQYATINTIFVWCFAALLPFCVIREFDRLNEGVSGLLAARWRGSRSERRSDLPDQSSRRDRAARAARRNQSPAAATPGERHYSVDREVAWTTHSHPARPSPLASSNRICPNTAVKSGACESALRVFSSALYRER
jgi:hypothetical protein